MDDETRQAFQRTAKAFGDTAEAFQRTARSFEETADAFRPRNRDAEQKPRFQPDRPTATDPERGVRLFIVALIVALVGFLVYQAIEEIIGRDPQPYGGIDRGLVFARCDQPMLGVFEQSVQLWGVDAGDGSVIRHGHADVDLPELSRLTYPCDTLGGLARRLFDTGFRNTVVQVSDPGTGAEWVGEVSLTARDPAVPTPPQPPSMYSPHPHNGLAVYGPDGRTMWYRSANDGSVHRVQESVTEAAAVTIDPAAEAFAVLTDDPARLFVQGDRTTDPYAADLALPNPTGDMAAAPGMLYTVGERTMPLRCSTLALDPAKPCLRGDLGRTNAIRPAAWLDDRTLLAINGPSRGANTLLRIEIDGGGHVHGCPAVPASDWSHRAVAVEPGGDGFVTDAVRNGERMLFYWSIDAADNQMIEQPAPDVPDDARLITWQPDTAPRGPVAHVCGSTQR